MQQSEQGERSDRPRRSWDPDHGGTNTHSEALTFIVRKTGSHGRVLSGGGTGSALYFHRKFLLLY